MRGRGISRLPESERWNPVDLPSLQGFPWDLRKRKSEKEVMAKSETSQEAIVKILPAVPAQRKRYVLKSDVERFGGTDQCRACVILACGGKTMAGVAHNDECRERITELLEREVDGAHRLETWRARRDVPEVGRGGDPQTKAPSTPEPATARPEEAADADVDIEIDEGEAVGAPVTPMGVWRKRGSTEQSSAKALRRRVGTKPAT